MLLWIWASDVGLKAGLMEAMGSGFTSGNLVGASGSGFSIGAYIYGFWFWFSSYFYSDSCFSLFSSVSVYSFSSFSSTYYCLSGSMLLFSTI